MSRGQKLPSHMTVWGTFSFSTPPEIMGSKNKEKVSMVSCLSVKSKADKGVSSNTTGSSRKNTKEDTMGHCV